MTHRLNKGQIITLSEASRTVYAENFGVWDNEDHGNEDDDETVHDIDTIIAETEAKWMKEEEFKRKCLEKLMGNEQ